MARSKDCSTQKEFLREMVISWGYFEGKPMEEPVAVGWCQHDDDQYVIKIFKVVHIFKYHLYKNGEEFVDYNQKWHKTLQSAKDTAESFLEQKIYDRFSRW